jgi:hypothetical protein
MQRLGAFIRATARHCHSAFSTLLGMRHPRHQLVANATMDEAFLQAGARDARVASAPADGLGLLRH